MEQLTTFLESINGYAMTNFIKQMEVIRQNYSLTEKQVVQSMLMCIDKSRQYVDSYIDLYTALQYDEQIIIDIFNDIYNKSCVYAWLNGIEPKNHNNTELISPLIIITLLYIKKKIKQSTILEIFQIYSPNIVPIALNCNECKYECVQEYIRSLRNPVKYLLKYNKYNSSIELKVLIQRFIEELKAQRSNKNIKSRDYYLIVGLFQELDELKNKPCYYCRHLPCVCSKRSTQLLEKCKQELIVFQSTLDMDKSVKTPCSYLTTFAQAFSECIQEYSYSKAIERAGFYNTTLTVTYLVNGIKKVDKFVGKATNKQVSKHLSATIGLLTLLPFLCQIALERNPDRHKPYGIPKILKEEVKHDEPQFGKEIVKNHPLSDVEFYEACNAITQLYYEVNGK